MVLCLSRINSVEGGGELTVDLSLALQIGIRVK